VALCSGGLGSLVAKRPTSSRRACLTRIDEYVTARGLDDLMGSPDRPHPTVLGTTPTELDLRRFSAVVWATGYRPSYPWLDPAAFDPRHRVAHDGGVGKTPRALPARAPVLRRRRSNLIAGFGADARDVCEHCARI